MRRLLILLAAVAALAAVYAGWRHYTQRYTVSVEDDGEAVTRVIVAALHRTSALKVSTLSGVVQSSAGDARLFGVLRSDQVMKAPFTVDYFVDLRHLGARDLAWDGAAHRLTIDVPDVVAARPNIDQGRRYLIRTRGLIVTRGASEELARKVALGAERAAAAEASKPARLARARDNARHSIGALLSAPLAAAGLRVEAVTVRFPAERGRVTERWDLSRAPASVLANAH